MKQHHVLYRRQRELLNFLERYIEKFGYAPTLGEIGQALNIRTPSTVHEHLAALEKKGFIRRYHGALRGIEILRPHLSPAPKAAIELPILGFIAAGQPIEPYFDPNASLLIPSSMINNRRETFILQVKGNSMIGEGILDQDYLIVEKCRQANNGEIVVAVLENGFATVKKFYRQEHSIRLEPANSEMEPIIATKVEIRGRVIGVIRHFNNENSS